MFSVKLTAHGTAIVGQITLSAGETDFGTPTFDTPFLDLKTANGLGLGATAAAVRRAYLQARTSPGSSSVSFSIVGHGKLGTSFTCEDDRVTTIEMQAVSLG